MRIPAIIVLNVALAVPAAAQRTAAPPCSALALREAMDAGVAPQLVGCVYTGDLAQMLQQLFHAMPATTSKANAADSNTILAQSPGAGRPFERSTSMRLVLSAGPAGPQNGRHTTDNGNDAINIVAGILKIADAIQKNQQHDPPQKNDNPPTHINEPTGDGSPSDPGNGSPLDPTTGTGDTPAHKTPPKHDTPPTQDTKPAGATPADTTPAPQPNVSNNEVGRVPVKPPKPPVVVRAVPPPSDNGLWPYLPYALGVLALAAVGAVVGLRKPPALPPTPHSPPAPSAVTSVTLDSEPAGLSLDGPLLDGPKLRIAVSFESTPPTLSEAI